MHVKFHLGADSFLQLSYQLCKQAIIHVHLGSNSIIGLSKICQARKIYAGSILEREEKMRQGRTGPRKATNSLVHLTHRAESNVVISCCTLPTVRLISNPCAALHCDLCLPICGHICRTQMVRLLCDPVRRRHSSSIGHGTALQLGSVPGSSTLHAQKPYQKPCFPTTEPFLLFSPPSISDAWMIIGLNL